MKKIIGLSLIILTAACGNPEPPKFTNWDNLPEIESYISAVLGCHWHDIKIDSLYPARSCIMPDDDPKVLWASTTRAIYLLNYNVRQGKLIDRGMADTWFKNGMWIMHERIDSSAFENILDMFGFTLAEVKPAIALEQENIKGEHFTVFPYDPYTFDESAERYISPDGRLKAIAIQLNQ